MRLLLRLALLLALSIPASAATYYVSAAGADTNAGTATTTSWLHAPGMPNCSNTCASTTINPGDKIILRGGDVWHANLNTAVYMGGNWNFTTAGSSGSLIYIGAQKNWYTGASWVKPVVTGDNPVFNGTSFPASCTYDYGTPTQKFLIQISQYNTFDNIAYLGDCWSGSASGFPGQLYAPGNDTLTNLYCHGWTLTSTSSDAVPCIASQGSNNIIEYNVFDGSDAPSGAAGSAFCTNSPAGAPCTTGIGIYDAGAVVAFNVFHQIRVGGVLVDSELVHDNTFEYMAPAPISSMGVQHDDAIMYYHGGTSASGVTEYLYNNVVRHNWINEQFYIPVSGGSTAYIFGNVFYDNHNAAVGNCIQLNAQSSGTQTLMLYNNTIDQDTDNSSGNTNGCKITFWGTTGGNSFGIPWTGPVFTANNHLIGLSTIGSLFGSNSGATYTVTQNGGDLLQPTATARAQGYTETDNPIGDSPQQGCTPATCSTVQAGTNQSAQILTLSPDTFGSYSYATSGGAALVSEFGGLQAVYPAIYQNPRPATWDVGAFQYAQIQTFAFNADNLYCPTVGCTPSWGATDGPATLPIAAINTANTPSPGSVISVGPTTAALTSALAAATCGETLQLTAGASYGNITWPTLNCSQSNWLRLTVAGASTNLPPQGTRITPAYSGVASLQGRPPYAQPSVPGTYTAQIGTSSTTSPITFHSGTSYAIIGPGVEITNNSGGYVNALINIGQIGGISNIILDRVWCHGNENISETQRCLDVSSTTNVAVIDSTLTDFVCYTLGTCSDAQGILGGENCVNSNPEGPYKFVNDFIESTGENILFGGGCGLTVPADMEIRLNTFFKPRWWNAFDPSYVPAANGQSYEIKNLFELKNGNRVLFEGNTLQNSWASAQNGSAFLLTPVNQGGNCPTCEDANIASRYNTISTSCTPFELALVNNGSGDAAAGNSYSIHDNVADNQGYATGGCTTGQPGLELTEDTAITSPAQTINNVTLNHNTIVHAASRASLQAIISLTGPTIASGGVMYNIALTNDLMWSGSQGTSNEQGGSHPANCANAASTPPSTVIPVCWNPNTVAGNCFVNNGSLTWPGTNTTSVASFTAVFNTYNGGNVGNYRVAAGACKGAATDGLDPGANITTLTSVLAGGAAPSSTPKVYVLSPPLAGGPALASMYASADGGALIIPWTSDSPLNPSLGGWESSNGGCTASAGYSWTNFDNVINTQLGYGAASMVVHLAPTSSGGQAAGVNHDTPCYVFSTNWATSLGAPQLYTCADTDYPGAGTITPGHCAQGVDNTAFPVAFQTPFVTAWSNAVAAALAHMKAASYASKIAYVSVGGGTNGEWLPYAVTGLETQITPSTIAQLQTTWLAYMSTIESTMIAANSGFNLNQTLNGGLLQVPYTFADAAATLAVGNGFGLADQGMQGSDITAFANFGNASGGSATNNTYPSGDHAYNFSTYPGAPIHEFQSASFSNPQYVGTPPAGTQGSLVPMLPYGVARGGTRFELYYADWQVAYDSTVTNYANYHLAYQQSIQAVRLGGSTLTVTSGTGGSVIDNYQEINCTAVNCIGTYVTGTTVTMTAVPNGGYVLAGWTGACSGTGGCSVTMSSAQVVGAVFVPVLAPSGLTVVVFGSGSVTSSPPGIACPATSCTALFTPSTVVTLTESPTSPDLFNGWSGACIGRGVSCPVTMNGSKFANAFFVGDWPGSSIVPH